MKVNRLQSVFLGFILLAFSAVEVTLADSVNYEFAESSRSIMRAGPDQSLSLLVQQIYPDNKKLWPRLEKEIRDRNPHAFNRYTGRIIPGQRIKLVTIKVVRRSYMVTSTVVGSVNSVKGYAVATDTNGNERRLAQKAELFEGDRLTTEKGATLVIKMIDDAELHIKQDSSLRLTEYKMKSGFETGSASILDLIKGGLRKITGAIGANPLSVYRFQAGVMTIGVRGTDYVVQLCTENDCNQSASRNDPNSRLHVAVLDGLISLQDQEGAIGELIMGQYAVASAEAKVKVTDSLPVNGLLNAEEQEIFSKLQPPEEETRLMWPWLLGGALLGI